MQTAIAGNAKSDGAGHRGSRWRLVRPIGLVFLSLNALSIMANLAFHTLSSHVLGPGGYGAVGSVLAMLAVLAVPAMVAETLVASAVARRREAGEPVNARHALHWAAVAGAVCAAGVITAGPVMTDLLYLPASTTYWVAVYAIPLALITVTSGVLCGTGRFGAAGLFTITGAAVRIVIGLIALPLSPGVGTALAAVLAGDLVRLGLSGYAVRRSLRSGVGMLDTPPAIRAGLRQGAAGTVALGGLWLLFNVDTVIARHYLTADESGHYTAASTTAKVSLFAAAAMCTLAVPRFAATDPASARRALTQTVTACLALAGTSAAALVLFGPLLLPVLFGPHFRIDRVLLVVLGIFVSGLALLWACVQFRIARGWAAAGGPWLGCLAGLAGLLMIPVRPLTLALVLACATWLTAAAVIAALLARLQIAAIPQQVRSMPLVGDHADGELDITVVVPYHNPGSLLLPHLSKLVAALRESGSSFEVIAVADGCTDGSPRSIAAFDETVVRQIILPRNAGKGAALRAGLRQGRGRYLGFIDADGDLDPAHWPAFLELIKIYDPDMVVGTKDHPLSHVDPFNSIPRQACSLGYRALVKVLFPALPFSDTQVGMKVFRRELLAAVLPLTVEQRFVFDLEVLVAASLKGFTRIMPAPITLHARTRSTVNRRAVVRMITDTLKLAWRVHVRHHYDTPGTAPVAARVPASSAHPGLN